ncbi:hypothetical protein ACDP63_08855 [Paracoccus sp. P2]|uniref:hypothetical protein n=1 Tax=Paracoccus sp. P2 TaxID=3248840 RepID=UPI00391EF4C2
MTQHDKARELVELDNYLRDPSVGLPWEIRIKIADLITAQAEENRRLREALRGMVGLYDSDEGTRSLPEVVAARAALSSTGEKG